METGELSIYDPDKILAGAKYVAVLQVLETRALKIASAGAESQPWFPSRSVLRLPPPFLLPTCLPVYLAPPLPTLALPTRPSSQQRDTRAPCGGSTLTLARSSSLLRGPAKARCVPSLALAGMRAKLIKPRHVSFLLFLQIFIWDMSTISSSSVHYTPGSTASKPGDVTSLAWNAQAEYILASSLSTGYTIIWDLRKKTQIRTLQYSGPSGSAGGPFGGASGSRASMSSVCWHPENVSLMACFPAASDPPWLITDDAPSTAHVGHHCV